MTIVASSDLGDLGPSESEPVLVEWHWYYHWPILAGWIFVGALLVLVKENRNRQGWAILIPFVLLSGILWPWLQRLLASSPMPVDQYELCVQWVLAALTALWLISPWLARLHPILACALALGLSATIGFAAQFGVLEHRHCHWSMKVYGISIFAFLLAFIMSRVSCRKACLPKRFLARLLPWLVIGVFLGLTYEFIWLGGQLSSSSSIPLLLLRIILVSVCMGTILYLLNLPFMYLAFRCPTYRDRFHKLLRLPEYVGPAATPSDDCAGKECELP